MLGPCGAFLSTEVAKTIFGGVVQQSPDGSCVTPELAYFAGLIGIRRSFVNANLAVRQAPSSTSHAFYSADSIGAALVGAGIASINIGGVLSKVIIPALAAPLTAGIVAFVATKFAYSITRRNDGKKERSWPFPLRSDCIIIADCPGTRNQRRAKDDQVLLLLTLIAAGLQEAGTGPHIWVIVSCALAIAIGTYSGGWRIIRTMGAGLTK